MKLWKVGLFVLLLNTSLNTVAGIGTITDQVAAVPSIQRSKTTLQGTKGTAIAMLDSIQTTKGKAGITFADDTKVQINENSKIVIDDFVYDPKNKDAGKLALNMASGTARYASGAISKNNPSKVAINTPSATIAVRGTDFTTTVDELGSSTIILLPSCKYGWLDIERDCKTGIIDVITDVGKVTLDKPFHSTKVDTRGSIPLKPVVLNLSEDAINNLLIVSPPREIVREQNHQRRINAGFNFLDVDQLKETFLVNPMDLDMHHNVFWKDTLTTNLLDQDFLVNIVDLVSRQLLSNQLDVVSRSSLLPDWYPESGVIAIVDPQTVTLLRDDGSNVQSVNVPRGQNSTVTQIQGSIEITNRVNATGTTFITLKQN